MVNYRLLNLTFKHYQPILQSLLTFSMTWEWRGGIGSYTITKWLGILRDMPTLEHLVIEHAMVQDTSTHSEALYVVHLAHLQRLEVVRPFHKTMTLLSCLNSLNAARLTLPCTEQNRVFSTYPRPAIRLILPSYVSHPL